jgi:hypothetical protein
VSESKGFVFQTEDELVPTSGAFAAVWACRKARDHSGSKYRKPFELIFQRTKNEDWLALEGDFRTLSSSQVITELPELDQILGSTNVELAEVPKKAARF